MTDPEYFLRRQERADGEWRFGTGDRWLGWNAVASPKETIIGHSAKFWHGSLGQR